jgi:hypothetical protein
VSETGHMHYVRHRTLVPRFPPPSMSSSSYRQQILAEIRDGQRSWSFAPSGDYEVFRTQVVEPLRQLKYDGVIPALDEVESPENGETRVITVRIIGAVDIGRGPV